MSKDWKDTLLMPETEFGMKAGLINKEPEFRKWWLDNNIYQKALEQNKGNEKFILHDGPPYANGSLHVGHALNKILKDIIVRYKSMRGFYSPFVPGWDTHGLPIENKMLEELKMSKDDMDKIELRKEAAKYAQRQVEGQQNQFSSMNLFTDFSDKYLTLYKDFEVNQLKLLKKMVLDKLIYKGLKPVYWSPSSQSALAEAEVEYEDIRSPQVIVAFKLKDEDANLLIMTTTPWTLIANSGVAVGESFDYSLVKANGNKYYVASQLVDSVAQLAKWEDFEVETTIKGKELVGKDYIRPIKTELTGKVISGHHVTTEAGTGLVHMAPLFGEDDFIIGKANDLEMIMHVEGDGSLNDDAGEYSGMFYLDANKNIGEFLDKNGQLLSLKFVKHSYPMDWRTHKPVIYRGVPQWFVSIDKIKQNILTELSKMESYPEWGISRMSKMIDSRHDWTISRQRTWGVPIVVFYDETGTPILDKPELFDNVISLVQEFGTDVWWEKETDELLPEQYRGKGYTREMDIMDVWFDSGSSWMMLPEKFGVDQSDLYLEGSDQYRGWFNSSLINSIAYQGKSPYKKLLSHGFVLDGKNQKMSKSKGNVMDPFKIINKNGADILRLWVANSEYTSDVSISDDIIKQTSGVYRNIRGKLRFMLGNLADFDITKNRTEGEKGSMQEWIAVKHNRFMEKAFQDMDDYKISKVVKDTSNYITWLSSWYLDIAKDSLYADGQNSKVRRMFQTNIYNIVQGIILLLAPIMPTTMEEAYREFKIEGRKESVFLHRIDDAFKFGSVSDSKELDEKMDNFFELKDRVYKAIEEAKQAGMIKRANEALVTIDVEAPFTNEELRTMFMVAAVKTGTEMKIENPNWDKCQRCWNHFETLSEDGVCSRWTEIDKG